MKMDELRHNYGVNSYPDADIFDAVCERIETDDRIHILEKKPLQFIYFETSLQEYITDQGMIRVFDDYDEWMEVRLESDMDLSFLGYKE